jgi:hypothetical protein
MIASGKLIEPLLSVRTPTGFRGEGTIKRQSICRGTEVRGWRSSKEGSFYLK